MTDRALSRFPAVLIGGPPHAGKSVLSHSLKQALKQAGVQCYLLRAAPDGEGDWSQETEPDLARSLRRKGTYTPAWVERMCRDIAHRPLPYLVDVGGKPAPWQEAIFDQCTHAILLVKDAGSRAYWQAMVDKYNLLSLAVLTSQQYGRSVLEVEQPALQGIITRLERGEPVTGPVFEALLARLQALFNYAYDELLRIHTEQAPTDMVVDIARLYKHLNPSRPGPTWQPLDLPRLFDYLPRDTPLALYGNGPAWLYTAIALAIFPAQFYQFNARRWWVEPASFKIKATPNVPLAITAKVAAQSLYLHLDLTRDYLDYRSEITAPLPVVPATKGLILSGKLPNWLYTGLALFYRRAPWVALYYPPGHQAIIVGSGHTDGRYSVGQWIDMAGDERVISTQNKKSC